MRLRNIPGARETLAENDFVLQDPAQYKGSFHTLFGNSNPIHIEIGMGKGRFITELDRLHPGINYLCMEKYSSVLIRALDKIKENPPSNLYFLRMDAEDIAEIFAPDEVDRIYLNFSDPWPKDRHAKRRLTSSQFLERYDKILTADGQVIFKTDNRPLFDFSLEEIEKSGWILDSKTYDLHHSEYTEGNVMTEYEEKFSAQGNPIHQMTAHRIK
ncbi:MAG: tRNA (guanosine(46)-N7)-methyltransferase TrmB [Acetivibrio ethanolgignens]